MPDLATASSTTRALPAVAAHTVDATKTYGRGQTEVRALDGVTLGLVEAAVDPVGGRPGERLGAETDNRRGTLREARDRLGPLVRARVTAISCGSSNETCWGVSSLLPLGARSQLSRHSERGLAGFLCLRQPGAEVVGVHGP
jgi:hypothetical protein